MLSANPPRLGVHPAPQRIEFRNGSVAASILDGIEGRVDPRAVCRPQGYALTITKQSVDLVGHDDAGLFYGHQTLLQLAAAHRDRVPCLAIQDWPDLLTRGYLLDVSRDRVPTMATLKRLIDKLAYLKINQFQLYTEHTIAYEGHESVWRDASALTFDELREIEAYSRERFIDFVPCQNVFGHMHRWLNVPEYQHLAECPDGWDTPWGYRSDEPFSLNPADPGSFELSVDLIDQLARSSRSSLFNLCCDETLDIGQGKSRELCERDGRATVYLNYLTDLCKHIKRHGKVAMFWGDIVLKHPELVTRIPRDAVLLNWGYESNHPFKEQSRRFREESVRFYVCTGTSSWCSLTGRGQNAVDNLCRGAEAALEFGAEGYLITDWGDYGHWQPFAISWLGLTYGAGVAWAINTNRKADRLPQAISRVALDEPGGVLGRILWDLSNVYLESKARFENTTWWFRFLRSPELLCDDPSVSQVSQADVRRVLSKLQAVAESLNNYTPRNHETRLLKREIGWCIDMSRWVCERAGEVLASRANKSDSHEFICNLETREFFNELILTYRDLWLERCREGGLDDSIAKLTKIKRRDCDFNTDRSPFHTLSN